MTDPKIPSVTIYMPNRGQIETETTASLMALTAMFGEFRAKVDGRVQFYTGDSLISRARNECAAHFLHSERDYMMFIDSDIVFKPEDLLKLWSRKVWVVGANYPVSRRCITDKSRMAVVWEKEGPPPDFVVIPQGRVPTGFLMIHREAFLKVRAEGHAEFYKHEDGGERWGFFIPFVEDEVYLSEDYAFMVRCRRAGIPVHMDNTIDLGHIGRKEWRKGE